jgi:hypothetical protein
VIEKKSLADILKRVTYLPNRTPEMAFNGGTELAFSEVAAYRNGAISVGYYSGNTEWERHRGGDEIVMSIEGRTTLVLLVNGEQHRIELNSGELVVVPQGYWHRFEAPCSSRFWASRRNRPTTVLTYLTPNPSLHSTCASRFRGLHPRVNSNVDMAWFCQGREGDPTQVRIEGREADPKWERGGAGCESDG